MFVGITAIPQLLSLAYQLTRVAFLTPRTPAAPPPGSEFLAASPVLSIAGYSGVILLAVVAFIVYFISYLFAQGGTVFAVSELYLGRTTTIGQSLSRVWGELWSLFWAILFYFVTLFFSFVFSFFFLFFSGFYILFSLSLFFPLPLL